MLTSFAAPSPVPATCSPDLTPAAFHYYAQYRQADSPRHRPPPCSPRPQKRPDLALGPMMMPSSPSPHARARARVPAQWPAGVGGPQTPSQSPSRSQSRSQSESPSSQQQLLRRSVESVQTPNSDSVHSQPRPGSPRPPQIPPQLPFSPAGSQAPKQYVAVNAGTQCFPQKGASTLNGPASPVASSWSAVSGNASPPAAAAAAAITKLSAEPLLDPPPRPPQALPPQPPPPPPLCPSEAHQPAASASVTHASPGSKRRNSARTDGDVTQPSSAPLKRPRPDAGPARLLPRQYELCPIEDMVVLVAHMISELIERNDGSAQQSGKLTRFHSRSPPGISVLDYLHRLARHANLVPPLLLVIVYYIDRLCALYPDFTINTLTVHRFLITAATVAAKGLSDSFWNNSTYARVGGVRVQELRLLELEFLYRVDWRIVPNPDILVAYYRGLIARHAAYVMEGDEETTADQSSKSGSTDILCESDDPPGEGDETD